MAQTIVGGLFGVSPYDIASQRINEESLLATNFAQLTPQQQGQYGMYAGGAGLVRAGAGLLGAEDPAMIQARQMQQVKQYIAQQGLDINSPEGLAQAAQYAQSIGATEGAMVLGQQARQISRSSAEEQLKLAQAEKASRENVGEIVDRDLYAIALRDAGNDPLKAAQLYNERRQLEKRSVAAAGAAQYGQEKIGNLSGAQGIVEKYTKQPFERLQAIDEAKGFLGMANEGNTAAVPQLRRALVRLGGPDSQLAAREIASIAGNAGIVGNVANAVNNFFTGTPTKEEIKLIGKVIAGAEGVIADQYTQGRKQAETVLGAAKLDPQTREALLPPAFKKAEPKKATSTGGWKILEVK
jgi:hypothetical protein